MSNISKNLLLALTLVCVIALIVFCIQLIVLNRGVEPKEQGSVVAGGPHQEDGGPNSNEPADGDTNTDGDDRVPDPDTQQTPRPPPQGTRRTIMVSDNSRLIIYAQEELFDYDIGDIDWWFTYKGEGNAALGISFEFITFQGVAAHAEAFLNSYAGGDEAIFSGEEAIKGSSLRGYHVTTQRGGETFEAWLYPMIGSDISIVFVINYSNDQQRDALYEVLSTMDMEIIS